jgi:hypothetical protein
MVDPITVPIRRALRTEVQVSEPENLPEPLKRTPGVCSEVEGASQELVVERSARVPLREWTPGNSNSKFRFSLTSYFPCLNPSRHRISGTIPGLSDGMKAG